MFRKVHPWTVLLLSATRPSINLTFSCNVFYSIFFLRKTDPQSTNYLKNRKGYAFPDYDRFCPPFWKWDSADNEPRTRNVLDFCQCTNCGSMFSYFDKWFLNVTFRMNGEQTRPNTNRVNLNLIISGFKGLTSSIHKNLWKFLSSGLTSTSRNAVSKSPIKAIFGRRNLTRISKSNGVNTGPDKRQ